MRGENEEYRSEMELGVSEKLEVSYRAIVRIDLCLLRDGEVLPNVSSFSTPGFSSVRDLARYLSLQLDLRLLCYHGTRDGCFLLAGGMTRFVIDATSNEEGLSLRESAALLAALWKCNIAESCESTV